MDARVECPDCAAVLRVRPEQIGRRGRCRHCDLVFVLRTPVGQRLADDDEPESPQVIEEPASQKTQPADTRPRAKTQPQSQPESDDPFSGLDADSRDEEPEVERPRRRRRRPERDEEEPEPRRAPWGVVLALAGVTAMVFAVGGFFLVRHLTADKDKGTEPEVVANNPADPSPAPRPAPKKEPPKTTAGPVGLVEPLAPVRKPAAPTTLKFDGPVAALYPAGEGRFVLFHVPTLQQLVVYDAAAGKVTATIPGVDSNALVAGGRGHAFVGQRTNGRVTRYDLRTGAPAGDVVAPGAEQLRHMAIGCASDGPLVTLTSSGVTRLHARLYDPDARAPIDAPIEDPARPAARSFPLSMTVSPSQVSVSADGRAICLSDRLYTRTVTGYSAVPINPSSWLRPVGDGSLAVGNSVWGDDGRVLRLPDRNPNGLIPAANGALFIAADYPRAREVRLALYADKDLTSLGDLPSDAVSQWVARDTGFSMTSLHRHLAFLPDPGLLVFCPTSASEAQIIPVDLPAMLAKAGRDVVFTSVPPATLSKDRPYTHTVTAVARTGARPTFALAGGPAAMSCAADGALMWEPAPAFSDAPADVRLVARTADGKKAEQRARVFAPLSAGAVVAVGPAPKLPADPPPPPKKNPVDPFVPPKKNPVDPPVAPVAPAVAGKEVKLPGAASAIAVGGAGRYVLLHLPTNRQIAVFDATEAKVTKYIPAAGNKVLIAAGAEKLFVVLPDDGVIQRWDLKTFEKEVTAPLAVKGGIKAALMGSAATGPLWLVGGDRFAGSVTLLDTKTLKEIEVKKDGRADLHGLGEGVRVSADGKTLGTWRFGTSPSGLTAITLTDTTLKAHYEHDSVGHVTPGPDGRVMHTAVGRFTPDGKSIGERDGGRGMGARGSAYSFPAAQGTSLYINATILDRAGGGDPRKRGATLAVHWAADGRKLVDLPDVVASGFNQWDREEIGNDQRYMLLPAAKALVVFPETNDRLVVHPFDLDAALDKSGKDYLLVDAPPSLPAVRGEAFAQNLTIKSKRGGVKVKVDSGPDGLTVGNDGKVSWAVPKDFADNEVSVIVTVSDASGQETLQTLRLEVRGEKAAAVAVAPKDPPKDPPAVAKKDDPPAAPKDPPVAAKKDEVVTVKLPGAASAVTVGGGGKFIILHLPQQRQIAVFDVALGKVAKYLPTAEATVFMAAGQEHLFVANPTAKVIQRYSLKTFEKEATVQQPIDGTVAGMCMGSASKGPLLICPKGGNWGVQPVFVDPIKMKALPEGGRMGAASQFMRASADGRLFGWRNDIGSEGHGMTLVEIVGGTPKPRNIGAGTSLLLPSPDGRYVYCGEGVFNSQFKKLYPADGNNSFNKPFLPAVSGNLFMQLEAGDGERFPGDPMAVAKPGRVSFFLPGQYRPFAFIDKVEGLVGESYAYGGVRDPIMHDARVHLCPDAGRLVTIPMTNDKLILYPFDLEDLLKKSDTDYLLVTSEPPADAGRGTRFEYAPVVRSRKGGVKVKLDSGPEGMKLADGRLAWRVPDDFADKEVDVILTVSDATGQEIFQTFKLAVRDRKADEKAAPELPAPKADPKADPKGDKPVAKDGSPAGGKPSDLALKPAALTKDEQTVNLPSAAGEVVPAAGGRLLLIHLPKERKIAVFDTAEAKIIKYLPVAEDEAKFAAGREKLVILLPGANVIQRWSLATLERELSVANPIGDPVKALTMGSGSDGPLIVTTKSAPNGFTSPTLLLYDVKTFKKSEYEFGEGGRQTFHPQYPPEVRVSANGELITAWVWGLSPSGVYLWSLEGKKYKGVHHHDSWGALLPDPDGRTVYASGKVATADGKKLNDAPKGAVIPAIQGPLLLSLSGGDADPFGRGEKKPLRASVHLDRDSRPLLTLPELTGLTSGGRAIEQRVFLVPGAKLLAVLTDAGDKLVLHRFDLDAMLEKSEVDYLFVSSRAPASAAKGEAFRYAVQVKSRKGGVKFALDAAPKGMTIDASGVITWNVPKDFEEDSVSVILTVSDKSGQETIHSFGVPVRSAGAKP